MAKFNVDNLTALEVIAAFDRFELRREMSRTGLIKPMGWSNGRNCLGLSVACEHGVA